MNKVEYEKEQTEQLCGRLQRKFEQLRKRQWVLLGKGEEDRAGTLAYEKDCDERTLEFVEARRDNPENTAADTSRNPVP